MGLRYLLWCPYGCGKSCLNVLEKDRPMVYKCRRCKHEFGVVEMRLLNGAYIGNALKRRRVLNGS